MTLEISSALVKELRQKTGAGMMNCKKALQETNGDFKKLLRLYVRKVWLLRIRKLIEKLLKGL